MPTAQNKEIKVKIGAFPGGQIKEYTFPQGTSYQAGLKKAGLIDASVSSSSNDELDVRVNGAKLGNLSGAMSDGDQVLVFSKVRGN
ncbi:MAG TPA: hypothetical protein VFT82_00415 [Candidatus Paceibacterota bacterium]|nr:hypothetical protein [Candidatus Paceibacterota bacterium]